MITTIMRPTRAWTGVCRSRFMVIADCGMWSGSEWRPCGQKTVFLAHVPLSISLLMYLGSYTTGLIRTENLPNPSISLFHDDRRISNAPKWSQTPQYRRLFSLNIQAGRILIHFSAGLIPEDLGRSQGKHTCHVTPPCSASRLFDLPSSASSPSISSSTQARRLAG